jgi:hypothetical protein
VCRFVFFAVDEVKLQMSATEVTEITEVRDRITACAEAIRGNPFWVFSVNSVTSVAKSFLDRRF